MSFLSVLAEITGLTAAIDRNTAQLRRIADAVEHAFPPPPVPPEPSTAPHEFHVAESPEEYQERVNEEAQFAAGLNVAPWSPEFQQALANMRSDIMQARKDDGSPFSHEEADQIIRQAFLEAKAHTNAR